MMPRPMDRETQAAWDRTLVGQRESYDRAVARLFQILRTAADVSLARFRPGRKG